MKTIRTFLAISILFITGISMAQNNGTIKGTLVDQKNEPMMFAAVVIMVDSTVMYSSQTNDNGEFTIKDVVPGKYNVKSFLVGYNTYLLKGVVVDANKTQYLDIKMSPASIDLPEGIVEATWTPSVIDPGMYTVQSLSIEQIDNAASGKADIVGLITLVNSDILPTADGSGFHVRGARTGSTAMFIDGNRTMGSSDLPGMSIGGMEILTGGVPAEYGDCTAGVILISTKDYKAEMLRKDNARRDAKEKAAAAKKEKQK